MSLLATSSVSIINVDDGQAYALQPSNSVIIMNEDGDYKPSQLSFQSVKLKGTDNPSSYSGRFKIEKSSDETNWTTEYTSSSDESSTTYTIPSTIEEKTPYNFRATGNGNNVGSKAFDTIVGGTVAWNQLLYNGNFADGTDRWSPENASGASISAADGVMSVTVLNTPDVFYKIGLRATHGVTAIPSHKYLLSGKVKSPVAVQYGMRSTEFSTALMSLFVDAVANTWTYGATIFNANGNGGYTNTAYFAPYSITEFAQDDVIQYADLMLIDLTQMFGSTIADYIYSLEQSTAGAGVAWFKKLFPKDYYEYNAGELKSVDGLQSHETVGKNAFYVDTDKTNTLNGITATFNAETQTVSVVGKNTSSSAYIILDLKCTGDIPREVALSRTIFNAPSGVYVNLVYRKNGVWVGVNNGDSIPSEIDTTVDLQIGVLGTTTSINATNIKAQIELGSTATEYEPYVKHTYPLDNSLTLRGIPKLDANNNLYYDGDTYESDGTVIRRYGIVVFDGSADEDWFTYDPDNYDSFCFVINNLLGNKSVGFRKSISDYGTNVGSAFGADGNGIYHVYGDHPTLRNTYFRQPNSTVTSVAAWRTWLASNPITIVYELATPTTETAEPYVSPQIVDRYGTEEYITDNIVPVGHETKYTSNISSIRCSLYASGGTTTLLDQQIIPVINDAESAVYMTKQIAEYCLSDSSTSITGSGDGYEWADTMPSVPSGKYLWKRLKSYFSNGSIAYSDAICDIVMSGLVFDVDRNSNAITSKVWESDITSKINQYDGSTGAAIRDRVTQTETSITGITSRVSDVESETDSLGTRMTSAESSITQNANNIALKVSQDGVISSINQSPETIKISASKVNIEGAVTFSSFDSTLQNRLTTAESDASTAKSNASSAVSTANTASSNASSALTKVNNSIKSTTMHYLATSASSGVTTSTSGWTTTIQSITKDKPYLWTYQTITKINDTTSNTDPVISGVYGATGGKGDTGTGVTKVEQLYRTSNSTTAPAAPTSAVSSTSTSYNTWTLAMPTYNTSYPYYYICTQTTYDNGTVKWTTVSRSKALEDANSTANTANTNASNAVSTANTANTNASNAVSTANTANTNASNAVTTANQAKSKADSAASLLSTWTGDATLATTTINGGYIKTHTIESTHLATNAIMSQNYSRTDTTSPYSSTGAFLDLSTGNLYMPNFGVNGTTGAAYFNGTVNANAGKFGDDSSYWNIETVYDYNMQPHAALVGTGSPYLQTGNWQVSDNAVATRKYTSTSESSGNATYYKDSGTNTFYDVGMKIPSNFSAYSASDSSVTKYNKAFYYGRKYTGNNAPSLDSDWTYFFSIDSGGNVITAGDVYEGGVKLSDKYAAITDVGSAYLPKTGGTITGNLSVNGSFTTNLMLQTNLGSTSSAQLTGAANTIVKPGVTGTLGVGNGGTGKSSWTANRLIYSSASNAISELGAGTSGQVLKSNGSSAPSWVNQSTLSVGSATKATQDGDGNVITDTYRALDDNQFNTIDITDAQIGNLIVKGAARFINGLYGTASEASKVTNALTIQLNGGTTEGTNQFTYDGSAVKNINITRLSIGLGAAADKAVDTSIAASSSSTNLPTSAAVASFVEGKGYVTSSGVTSVRVQATSPVVSSVNTAQSSTLNTTISLADSYGDMKNPYGTKTANYILAGPSSGDAAAPSFRKLVAADIPSITKSKISDFPTTWALADVTGADDLKAIEGLTGTSGILKKTAANTWALSTVISGLSINNDVLTVTKSDGTTQDLTINITGQVVSGATILSDASGNPISKGSASVPVYFSNGVPVSANTIPTIALNGGNTTSPSFYAPTGAGTSGQYLKSNGSGAPTWATFSKSTVGLGNVDNTADANKNVLTATKFATAQSVTLTGDTTGTASSQAGWSITTKTDRLSTVGDNRTVATKPNDYVNKIIFQGLKTNSSFGSPSTDQYSYVVGLRGWSDHSGGNSHELAFNNSGIFRRQGDTTDWNSWIKIIDSGNYTDYTVTKTGSGASGTWGINISGNATNATNAKNWGFVAINELRFDINTKPSSATNALIGYKWSDGSTDAKINRYIFYNGGGALAGVEASTFYGDLSGNATSATTAASATKAMQDGSGNIITSYYCTLSTAQTLSGVKTFSAETSFTNTTASTSKTTGALKVSGGVGILGRVSADEVEVNNGCVMQFDNTLNCLNFVFN